MRLAIASVVVVAVVASAVRSAGAAPPEPAAPHPRILLDRELAEAWAAEVRDGRGPVVGAIALCDEARASTKYDRALYQGAGWAKVLQACLVAWAATRRPDHAATSLKYFVALLDDLDQVGDGKGGDRAATRDDGYAIRNLGPFTAVAYDWLHDAPGMTPALRERARARWAAWVGWYREHGYRRRGPGTNYHAGFVAAATLIAVAQAGEAGAAGAALWRFVADEMWSRDMAAALAGGGILDGGDWPEGWQYGPLAIANYTLAARVIQRAGVPVAGIEPWLGSVLRRHVHGLTPSGDRTFAAGDSESATANLEPGVLTLAAIAFGGAGRDEVRWAKGEMSRLKLTDNTFLLYSSLATIGPPPALPPRKTWPTWYLAGATHTIYARTRWDDRAVWFVAECAPSLIGLDGENIDHRHPNAGNFVVTRGRDDVIVDPSPYGALSSLTGNAPTVASAQLPPSYIPSQGAWGEDAGWQWAIQTAGGVIAARCDYAGQYRFKDEPSDVPVAQRDLVVLPSPDGGDAAVVVVDRATTLSPGRKMHLRFRVPVELALAGDVATATIGATRLAITGAARSSGAPAIGRPTEKNCYGEGTQRGKCDAARFPVTEYRVEIAGPEPRAAHVIGATGATPAAVTRLGDAQWTGVHIAGPRDAVVVWPVTSTSTSSLTYRAPRRAAVSHVVLDAPARDGTATVSAQRDGDACAVTVRPGGALPARPLLLVLDAACSVAIDPASAKAPSARSGKPGPPRGNPRSRRAGCCGTQTSPGSPLAMAVLVGALTIRRRRLR